MMMLIISLSLLLVFVTTFLPSLSSQDMMSLDWAGYVVVSDFVNPNSIITGVSGSWIVPEVNVSNTDAFSAAWIGIGGLFDNSLIQTGTEHDSINGEAVYSAWYELLPYDAVTIPVIDPSPGDTITASIYLANSTANEWSIEIVDVTKGQRFQENLLYDSSKLSAEWIVERPTVNNRLSNLADFENVTFTNASVTMNADVGVINSFPNSRTIMQNRQNRQLVTVSSLHPDGASFTVTYSDGSP
jgi:hypothetical protein